MKIQSQHTIFPMSLCSVLGMLGVLIFTLRIELDGLEPRTAWKPKDIGLRLASYSKCEGKIQERILAVKVVKKDKGTVITVRSYISEASKDVFSLAEFTSASDVLWQRAALCRHRNRPDSSEISGSGGRWGPV